MKRELDNAQKVERFTLRKKYEEMLAEKEKELDAANMEMRYSIDFRTYKEKAVKRASLTVDIHTINIKLRNLAQSKPILGYADGMASNFTIKSIGG